MRESAQDPQSAATQLRTNSPLHIALLTKNSALLKRASAIALQYDEEEKELYLLLPALIKCLLSSLRAAIGQGCTAFMSRGLVRECPSRDSRETAVLYDPKSKTLPGGANCKECVPPA